VQQAKHKWKRGQEIEISRQSHYAVVVVDNIVIMPASDGRDMDRSLHF
jgi:hypothetical protein